MVSRAKAVICGDISEEVRGSSRHFEGQAALLQQATIKTRNKFEWLGDGLDWKFQDLVQAVPREIGAKADKNLKACEKKDGESQNHYLRNTLLHCEARLLTCMSEHSRLNSASVDM